MAKKGKEKKRSLLSYLLRFIGVVVFSGLSLSIIFVLLIKAGYFGALPSESSLENIKNNIATEVYSSDGVLLGRFFVQERNPTSYENISPHVINALVATEDARFYDHKGVDPRSLLRVVIKTVILQDRSGGGGSTISQQLAKNMFPRDINTKFDIAVTKIKEALIAFQLESLYSKEEILELYLNTVPFGENIYGIELASQRFFSRPAKELKIQEAAVLVGMLKANHTYNPRLFPEKSQHRRNVVLNQMVKYDYLSEGIYDSLKTLPVKINYQRLSPQSGPATYFRAFIRPELEKWAEENEKTDGNNYNIFTDGLRIYTTIDSRIQEAAEASMARNMAYLQEQFDVHWKTSKPWDTERSILNDAIKRSSAYKKLKKKGLSHDAIITELKKKHPVDVFTHEGVVERNLSSIDSLEHYLMILQSGLVAMDPNNGHIKAWVGGIDFSQFQYDHVLKAKRQVGSTFKPFVYAAALEKGVDPCDHISASRTIYKNLEDWTPDNADKSENLMKYSFTGALAKSVNTVTIKLVEKVGVDEVIATAKRIGIDEKLPSVPSVALGTGSIPLLEMTKAYCTFANGGSKVQPVFLEEIKDYNGVSLYKVETPRPQVAIQKQTAQLMNHMLKAVVDEGTASSARWKYNLTNEIAGKTGTTQSNADGWFIGYNPKLVVGVWVGADDPRIRFRSTALGSGGHMALPIFVGMFKDMNGDASLNSITSAKFPALSDELQSVVACDDEKEDKNFLQKVLGIEKKDKAKSKEFGEEKKGFFKKLKDVFKKKDE
ncbi:MAG: PBP1A family penicillin-binding protein [Fulvivirga sp.]|uniref:penicillin-binding protein 1A n=1 Tax=Fulvivirga sp. TaxID=1931237 RepID=UPI0032EB3C62